MHRLTEFKHNIVCNINDIVNRTNSAGTKTFTHPTRRRLNLYVLDNSTDIAIALIGAEIDTLSISLTSEPPEYLRQVRDIKFCFECGGCLVQDRLLKDSRDGLSNFKFNDGIIKTNRLFNIHSRNFFAVIAQDRKCRPRLRREVVQIRPEFT